MLKNGGLPTGSNPSSVKNGGLPTGSNPSSVKVYKRCHHCTFNVYFP